MLATGVTACWESTRRERTPQATPDPCVIVPKPEVEAIVGQRLQDGVDPTSAVGDVFSLLPGLRACRFATPFPGPGPHVIVDIGFTSTFAKETFQKYEQGLFGGQLKHVEELGEAAVWHEQARTLTVLKGESLVAVHVASGSLAAPARDLSFKLAAKALEKR